MCLRYRKESPPKELVDKAAALWNFPSKNFDLPSEWPLAEMTKIHLKEGAGREEERDPNLAYSEEQIFSLKFLS